MLGLHKFTADSTHLYYMSEAGLFLGNGPFRMLGMMSGTSLDGLDLALVEFRKPRKGSGWNFTILKAETMSYSGTRWQQDLPLAYHLQGQALDELSKAYSNWLNGQARDFITRSGWEVDAVASHGHTVLHLPDRGLTRQIGNGRQLATGLGVPVVCDFRQEDMARGGQGAPLVPAADALLYPDEAVCLNLGGFSNASWVDRRGRRRAGDLGPVNIVLNALAAREGEAYDHAGKRAAAGHIRDGLLEAMKAVPFYQRPFPKSLGREWAEQNIMPLLQEMDTNDALATATEHAAWAIAHGLKEMPKGRVLVTGGGVYNDQLMARIKALSGRELKVPIDTVVQFKEAVSFALLGLLKLRGEVNVLASVTGGEADGSDGKVYPAMPVA